MKYYLIIAGMLTVSCLHGQYQQKDFTPLKLLEGTWKMQTTRGILVEQWTIINDSLMTSNSYFISNADTLPQEKAIIKLSNGMISFAPIVEGQNDGKPVQFILTGIENQGFIFENKNHDFPQKIRYTPGSNTLHVIISGIQDGKNRNVDFKFVKE